MKALLIAEKPSLMREIKSVYDTMNMNDEITFMCFAGHVMGLAKPGEYKEEWGIKKWTKDMLPMIPEKFKYVVSPDKKDMFNKLKNEVSSNKYDYIINACDPDREGQSIYRNFLDYIGCKLPTKRFWSNDITEESIKDALLHLRDNDNESFLKNLTSASQLRGHFDWLVGMNLSVECSLKMGDTCNIGRVKIPTLKILVDRELEIRNFKPTTSYELVGVFGGYSGVYFDEEGSIRFKSKEDAEKFAKRLSKNAKIESVTKKTENTNAPQLYCLNTLQQDGNKLYGYPAEKTKMLAQSLYEKKILSYPRSDNPYISTKLASKFTELFRTVEEIEELSSYAKMIAGDKALQAQVMKNKNYVNDAKMAESGHYAITPTGTKPNLASLSEDEIRILKLVCTRFVAMFLPPMKTLKTIIITNDEGNLFKTNGKKMLDKGYTVLYPNKAEDTEVPDVKQGDIVELTDTRVDEKVTKEPPRYTEGSLLAAMVNPIKFLNDDSLKQTLKEVKGIGTEATRDGIISELVKNGYIERKKKNIIPSEKAIAIVQNLKGRTIASVDLTGIWENKLSEIEKGTLDPNNFRTEMIEYVLNEIDAIEKTEMTRIKNSGSGSSGEVLGKCPKCQGNVIEGKSFYLCENYKKEQNGCNFIVKKTIMGAKLSKTEIVSLLKGNSTKEKELTKKDGTKLNKKLCIDSNGELSIEKASSIGKCPKCGEEVLNGKYYLCKNYKNGCDFIIGKTYGEAEITIDDVKSLLDMKQTPNKKTCKWKSGKTSTVFLKLDENYKLTYVSENGPKQNIKEIGKCPTCGGKILSSNNFYYCENHPDSCKFSIKKSLKGATIGDKDIKKLLNKETTDKIMFVWNPNKSSEARLKYTDKLEFVFGD